ncbi:hypothetical protein RIF29_19259 [Crotalaria pallida]|uniref:Uncharacterized protein n=1 Tax=Crotalaria pallida TaxID=3830 RepID=A0AAN9F3J2_CROPI
MYEGRFVHLKSVHRPRPKYDDKKREEDGQSFKQPLTQKHINRENLHSTQKCVDKEVTKAFSKGKKTYEEGQESKGSLYKGLTRTQKKEKAAFSSNGTNG